MFLKILVPLLCLALGSRGEYGEAEQAPEQAPELAPEQPPRPYAFSYAAGRYPGHTDRMHSEVSDGSGVVRGSYSYVDPRHQVRTVEYVADKDGFHPALSHAPVDTVAVAAEKERHATLYAHIAHDHATNPHPQVAHGESLPRETKAVQAAKEKHLSLYETIAANHALIAEQREADRLAAELEEANEHYH